MRICSERKKNDGMRQLSAEPPDLDGVAEILSHWGAADLAPVVDIAFSPRLRRTLGRTRVDARRVRLNLELARADPALLREVLCHELAHIVVYERHGRDARPHGPEWRDLMKRAGCQPDTRVAQRGSARGRAGRRRRYEHVCPVCQHARFAARLMGRWRCKSCRDAGLEGRLEVREVPT